MTVFGQGRAVTLGKCTVIVNVDDVQFTTIVHVIPNNAMVYDLIIGKPSLKEITITVNKEILQVNKRLRSPISCSKFKVNNLNKIHNIHDELDIGNRSNEEQILQLVENYKPTKNKTSEVTMKIIQQDEGPVFQSPRRLSPIE